MAFHDVHQLDKLHAEAGVGLVAAIIFHCIGPWHSRERLGELHAAQLLEEVLGHALEEVDDVVLLNVAHFAVDLSELGLAVGSQVFVAEAFYNLEVSVHARNHEKLLQGLRRLGQGIELSPDSCARALRSHAHLREWSLRASGFRFRGIPCRRDNGALP